MPGWCSSIRTPFLTRNSHRRESTKSASMSSAPNTSASVHARTESNVTMYRAPKPVRMGLPAVWSTLIDFSAIGVFLLGDGLTSSTPPPPERPLVSRAEVPARGAGRCLCGRYGVAAGGRDGGERVDRSLSVALPPDSPTSCREPYNNVRLAANSSKLGSSAMLSRCMEDSSYTFPSLKKIRKFKSKNILSSPS